MKLLAAAGWRLKDGTLINHRTGHRFRLVVLAQSPRHQAILGHWSDSKNNYTGLKSRAVDELADRLASAGDYSSAVFYGRLLDRVLQWKHLAVPNHFAQTRKYAAWDRFARPPQPRNAWGTEFWWCARMK